MTSRIAPAPAAFDAEVDTLILGAGAAGLVAALAAQDAGQSVLVAEADPVPRGSTALSAGLIPAAGTRQQAEAGISDTWQRFAADIQRKAKNQNDASLVAALAHGAAPAIGWLTETCGLPFSVVTDFDYPGHSARRMHGLPSRSGSELMDSLRSLCEARSIDILCNRRADVLFRAEAAPRHVAGARLCRPDGAAETVGCAKLVLACNGIGGNRAMVAQHMPGIADGLWFGHDGNRGDAVQWGAELGAATRHLGAYQGHGNVAHPHGILITWAVITAGGIQVNRDGSRFWDESQGYSEAARVVLAQPGGEAFAIFDQRIAAIARQFEDFRQAETQGAVRSADSIAALAEATGLPVDGLARALSDRPEQGQDRFGRDWNTPALTPPYCAVRVTGALFHTQGGLVTDGTGRVRHTDGNTFANLFAAGGAACGVSGDGDSGYLSGNGLLSAVVLGRQAGLAPLPDPA